MKAYGYTVTPGQQSAVMKKLYSGTVTTKALIMEAVVAGVPSVSTRRSSNGEVVSAKDVAKRMVEAITERERKAGRVVYFNGAWRVTLAHIHGGKGDLDKMIEASGSVCAHILQLYVDGLWVPYSATKLTCYTAACAVHWTREAAAHALVHFTPLASAKVSRIAVYSTDGNMYEPITYAEAKKISKLRKKA